MDYNSTKNQEIKGRFVDREVIYCVSMLVSELVQKAEHFLDYYDDLMDSYRGVPDYEEAARQEGWVPGDECKIKNDSKFVNVWVDEITEESDAESWEDLCNEKSIDAYEYAPEVLEHWIVSDWFADKLEAHGERVLKDFFGLTVWGRTTSGQAILLDGVISEICAEMEILEGQKNEWKV